MSLFRHVSVVAIFAIFAGQSLAANADADSPTEIAAPMTDEPHAAIAQPTQVPEAEKAVEKAEEQEPKMTCRYVQSATSRVGRRVCTPAKQ